jgi:hypothetical protein
LKAKLEKKRRDGEKQALATSGFPGVHGFLGKFDP